jgi:hypothetical protein
MKPIALSRQRCRRIEGASPLLCPPPCDGGGGEITLAPSASFARNKSLIPVPRTIHSPLCLNLNLNINLLRSCPSTLHSPQTSNLEHQTVSSTSPLPQPTIAQHNRPNRRRQNDRKQHRRRRQVLGATGELMALRADPIDDALDGRIHQFHHNHQQRAADQ